MDRGLARVTFFVSLFLILIIFDPDKGVSQSYTDPAVLMKVDKFVFKIGVIEYYDNEKGPVFVLPFILHLGLADRVEFKGIFPYLQYKQKYPKEGETFGDILLYLKFDIAKFSFHYPSFLYERSVKNYFDFITGFNIATGPLSTEEESRFDQYATGLPDWRIGFYYGQEIGDLFFDINFIYIFASAQGEEYLPFSGEIFSTSKNSYFFDIHKVFVKFFWPGRYPWAPNEAPLYEKYPHADDYFIFNTALNYDIYPNFTFFNYGVFVELLWLQSFHKISLRQTEILICPGLQVYLSGSTTALGSVAIPLDANKREYYFNTKYFIGLSFLL
ncbi:MAG: hypothetical protein JW827_08350 [Spirochaetes bacterium]|nr:hypothetical protein [Spirochaetota bacterium]